MDREEQLKVFPGLDSVFPGKRGKTRTLASCDRSVGKRAVPRRQKNGPVDQRSVLEQYTCQSVVETKISVSHPLVQECQATLEKKKKDPL